MVQWLFHQSRLGPVAHFIASVGATAESQGSAARWLIKAAPMPTLSRSSMAISPTSSRGPIWKG